MGKGVRAGRRGVGSAAEGAACAEPEAALVARARADPEAFGALYDRYAARVYRYCLARLGNREAAEDATGQTFAAALAALPRYRDEGRFGSWLFAIAHNAVADAGRRQGRLVGGFGGVGRERPDAAPSPEEAALAADDVRRLWALLAELPADQRRAVELRLAGLSGAEVAAAMGRSRNAVKLLQFRAIGRLRALMGVDLGGGKGDGDAGR